jgi:hypothetical protein
MGGIKEHIWRYRWHDITLFISIADPHHLDADSDPDPARHFDADPDPYLTFHFDADPDLDPSFQIKA